MPGHPSTKPGYPSAEPGYPSAEPRYLSTTPGYPSAERQRELPGIFPARGRSIGRSREYSPAGCIPLADDAPEAERLPEALEEALYGAELESSDRPMGGRARSQRSSLLAGAPSDDTGLIQRTGTFPDGVRPVGQFQLSQNICDCSYTHR